MATYTQDKNNTAVVIGITTGFTQQIAKVIHRIQGGKRVKTALKTGDRTDYAIPSQLKSS